MTVFAVSGASGFVGRALSAELMARGHRAVPIGRPTLLGPGASRALEGVDAFVHLAARAHVLAEESADPAAEFRRSNVDLTLSAARAAAAAGVRCFIFLSSAGVLGGFSTGQGFAEDSPPHPHDDYTASKLEAEARLSAELGPGMRLVILRPPLVYGAGARGNLMRLMRMALRGRPLPLGALRAPRSMIGIRNLNDLIVTAAHGGSFTRATMLAADGESLSVAEFYAAIAHEAGHHPWLAPLPAGMVKALLKLSGRSRDAARLTEPFVLRATVARRLLGWQPPHSVGEEIRAMVREEIGLRLRGAA